MIKTDEIDAAEELFSTPQKAELIWEAFKKDEPVLYSRMLNHARNVVSDVQKGTTLSPEKLIIIHNSICAGYMLAFTIIKKRRDDVFDKAEKEDQFGMFLSGRSPDSFYTYDIMGMDPESELVKAKNARERHCLESIRLAILPILAEDVGNGYAPSDILKRVEDNINGRKQKR